MNKSPALQVRHNERDGVSKHWRLDCLHNCLFSCRSKKTSKLRITGLCEGNPPVTGGFTLKGPVTRKILPFDDVFIVLQLQPGDMLWVSAHASGEAQWSVPYDIGDPEICGTSYTALYWEDQRVFTDVKTMSESWMPSLQAELTENHNALQAELTEILTEIP